MLGSKLDILKPEWIDVVFSGRNKAYGAYELRKENGRNTSKALVIAVVLSVAIISAPTIYNWIKGFIPKPVEKVKVTDVVLKPPPPIDQTKKPPPPPPEPPRPKVDQVKFPPPVVKPDNQVREQEPPTVQDLKTADPGQQNIKGDPNADIRIDEPVGKSDIKQVTEEDPNQVFTSVENEPSFPGGIDKFYGYLGRAIHYPAVARENNVQGRVIVQFVVEKDGSLTDVHVLRGIGSGCDEEAVRAVKGSPKWQPGIQNGRPVRVQYTVPVNFQLSEQ